MAAVVVVLAVLQLGEGSLVLALKAAVFLALGVVVAKVSCQGKVEPLGMFLITTAEWLEVMQPLLVLAQVGRVVPIMRGRHAVGVAG